MGGLARQLALLNGKLLNRQLEFSEGRLSQLVDLPVEKIVAQCYLLALSRQPTASESAVWTKELNASNQPQRREVLEDFVWSLLNCDEFVNNH